MELESEGRELYRFEYWEPIYEENFVDWVWLKPEEIYSYKPSEGPVVFRKATPDECDLYNEAYADGYGIAAILEFESRYDGITFRVELDGDGNLTDIQGKKMFQCAVCDRHLDFEENVSSAGGMYLGAVRDGKLWHICYDCAHGRAEVEWIEQGWVWDDDPGSANEKSS
jgi:hypothetical protein